MISVVILKGGCWTFVLNFAKTTSIEMEAFYFLHVDCEPETHQEFCLTWWLDCFTIVYCIPVLHMNYFKIWNTPGITSFCPSTV